MRPGSYEKWVGLYDTVTPADRAALRAEERQLGAPPRFSILLPVYNPRIDWLREAIDSVKAQTYSRWELCVADDASTDPLVRPFLEAEAKKEPRFHVVFRPVNGHISACSNSALALATGEWCGLLDQDDVLAETALSVAAREIKNHKTAGLIYSDEDFMDQEGLRSNPFIKPDWNPELFLGQNYINHFGIYRADLLWKIGGFREGFEGSQDYDLVLRCLELLQPDQVRHIPRILYHWRMVPGSLATEPGAKPYAKDAARRALTDHVQRSGIAARVERCPEDAESHRVTYEVPNPAPLVSIIIHGSTESTRTAECIRTLQEQTRYDSYEIIQVVDEAEPTSDAAGINRAAAKANGAVLVLLDSAVEITEPQWLQELIGQAVRAEVGAVGARLWSPKGNIAHSGFLLGVGGIAGDAHHGLPRGHPGFFNRTFLQRNCSAVSAACLAVRAAVFQTLGGFDERNLANRFHDIDFCLRVGERGLQVVWTPYVNPILHAVTGKDPVAADDEQYMRRRWRGKLMSDPFYSPILTLDPPPFELAFPPRG